MAASECGQRVWRLYWQLGWRRGTTVGFAEGCCYGGTVEPPLHSPRPHDSDAATNAADRSAVGASPEAISALQQPYPTSPLFFSRCKRGRVGSRSLRVCRARLNSIPKFHLAFCRACQSDEARFGALSGGAPSNQRGAGREQLTSPSFESLPLSVPFPSIRSFEARGGWPGQANEQANPPGPALTRRVSCIHGVLVAGRRCPNVCAASAPPVRELPYVRGCPPWPCLLALLLPLRCR
ncbi:hypothetical protein B0J12DRAFT_46786 [Macrophomina phaseolina]|uniref:Uncharacterized protein n=1 Tax=Macrophomina phaseolina TaxID=35725 RepID=A0ABQ8GED2_9PEZI|nr:hypothetical protein B0J12DRAFT_46786 [Macrophomina phaseolina]